METYPPEVVKRVISNPRTRSSFYWYNKASQLGEIDAMYSLSLIYNSHDKRTENMDSVFYWLHRCAEKGEYICARNLAEQFLLRDETEDNIAAAKRWMNEAIKDDPRSA